MHSLAKPAGASADAPGGEACPRRPSRYGYLLLMIEPTAPNTEEVANFSEETVQECSRQQLNVLQRHDVPSGTWPYAAMK